MLHSFSVPVFRLKQDAIPGRVITGWFKPTMTGTYDIQCAEICGIGHGLMPARIVIETAEQHAAWMAENARRGRGLGRGAARRRRMSRWRPLPLRIPTRTAHGHHEPGFVQKYLCSTDHKMIAMQYMFTGMAMALIGGFFAYVFRMQIAFPGVDVPGLRRRSRPNEYNPLITNHGTIMIFWVAMPVLIAAFGNFLIPLMIGCDDMVFPKLNRLSYQIFLLSVDRAARVVLRAGRRASAAPGRCTRRSRRRPEYNLTPLGATLFVLAVALEFVAFLMGGINFVTTAMNSRAPGMSMYDIPIVVWMIVIASILFMASVGPLIAGAIMLLFDQNLGTAFFDPDRGGDPILWQHLFWFFGHPEVYVVLLPAIGIVAEIITVFCAQEAVRLPDRALHGVRHRRALVHRVGAPPVHRRHRPAHGEHLHDHDAADLDPDRGDDVRLHRDALRRLDHAEDADAVGARRSSPSS